MTMPAQQMAAPAAPNLQKLVPEVLDKMFAQESFHHDLRGGTVHSITGTRALYLSTDLLRGIHEALEHETGDAWRIVLKNCGQVWGERVAKALQNDLRTVAHEELDGLPVGDYLALIEDYFASHGWGKLQAHLDDAESHGLIRFSLHNSLFAAALEDVQEGTDDMIAGMLSGLFTAISGAKLDCVQTACQRAHGASQFLLSDAKRVAALEQPLQNGTAPDAALDQLRAS